MMAEKSWTLVLKPTPRRRRRRRRLLFRSLIVLMHSLEME
jgi:hypothetical protein